MALLDLRVDDAITEAWNDFSAYVGRRFSKEITTPQWDWPRPPSPRDIVDTGNLRRSQDMTVDADQLVTTFTWGAPYAAIVHDGAVFKQTDGNGNPKTLTARPWTRPVMRDPKLRAVFAARFRLAMRRRATR